MSVLSLRGLHAFADLYVRGRLAEDFAKQYGVKPCREYGVPERSGAVCGGGELVELISKSERGRLKKGTSHLCIFSRIILSADRRRGSQTHSL